MPPGLEVTEPQPLLVTVTERGSSPNDAVTVLISSIATVHVADAPEQAPLHPPKVEPGAYGVPTNLARDGSSTGQAIVIEVTTKQGMLPPTRSNAVWNGANKYYEAQ